MENENTAKSRRWRLPAIINLCLVIMILIAFGANALTARADTTGNTAAASTEQWYEVDSKGERLFVYLHNRVNGYGWKYGSSNDLLRQLHGFEINETDLDEDKADTWRLYLVPRDAMDGDVKLTFVCVKDTESDSIDTRTLNVRIEDGKIKVREGQ